MIIEILHAAKYTPGGREWPHVDCYGLVLHVRGLLGMPWLPDLDGRGTEAAPEVLARLHKCDPMPGAVIACYGSAGELRHVGVVVEDGGQLMALDCRERKNAMCVPLARVQRLFHSVEFFV